MSGPDGYGSGFISADELREAMLEDLLTAEEARLIYWGQFPALRQQAATTPPPLAKTVTGK